MFSREYMVCRLFYWENVLLQQLQSTLLRAHCRHSMILSLSVCVCGYGKGKWKEFIEKDFLFFKNGQINLSFALCLSLSGGRVGSVQSDSSSSPTEHGFMGQSHPTYPVGPQVRTHIFSPNTISLTWTWNAIHNPFYIWKCNISEWEISVGLDFIK